MFEFREIKNKSEYNPLLISEDVPFTQAWFFGEWQEAVNRKVRRFEIQDDSKTLGFFQIIKYPLPFGQSFLYIPHGPIIIHNAQHVTHDTEFLKGFKKILTEIGKEENSIFVQFDFYSHNLNYRSVGDLGKYFHKISKHRYHSSYFQPKYEWIIDLNKTEEKLLGEMHPKTRYNIGLAKRRGIEIEIVSENFDKYFYDFYKLLGETAKRDNFNLHPKIYYQNIWRNCDENKNSFLAIAKYNNKILAINLILLFGNTAYFTLGGSNSEHKNLMFSHLAQWEAVKEAKKRGFKFYSFGAVNSKGFEGISRFKKGFGGELLEYSDSYDLILKPFLYKLYNLRKWVLNLPLRGITRRVKK